MNFETLYHKNLRFIANAGGKLNENLIKKIVNFSEKKKIKFYSMYGQTEASPRMSILDCVRQKNKINSIGNAINKNKFYLKDNFGKKIKSPFKKGELIYKGKNVCMGYSNNLKDLKK